MKALSVKEPWASRIAYGDKTIETRTWKTKYRGTIVICSSMKPKTENSGKALALAELVDCRFMREGDEDAAMVPVHPWKYAWVLENVRALKRQIPVKGKQGLYEIELSEKALLLAE